MIKKEKPSKEDIVNALESLRLDLSINDKEVIKLLASRWSAADDSIYQKEKEEILFSIYDEALNEAIKMLRDSSKHLEHSEQA